LLGGGALLDFCCYGANISLWWFGELPFSVLGVADRLAKPFGDAEDNAILVARYPKAFAVLEASWSQGGSVSGGPMVVGTEGAMTVTQREGQAGVLLTRDGKEEFVAADALPPNFQSGVAHFVAALLEGTSLHLTVSPDFNVGVQAILEAGLLFGEDRDGGQPAPFVRAHRDGDGDGASSPCGGHVLSAPFARFAAAIGMVLSAQTWCGDLPKVNEQGRRRIVGLVVPHAGYIYSGMTASRAYAALADDGIPQVAVLFAPLTIAPAPLSPSGRKALGRRP